MSFRLAVVTLSLALASSFTLAHETGECTTVPKSKWIHLDDAKAQLADQGYSIRKVKISGTCYELYGKDASGKKGEYFFDPVTLKLVEKK